MGNKKVTGIMDKSPDIISSTSSVSLDNYQRGRRRLKSFSKKYGKINTNLRSGLTDENCIGDTTDINDLTPGSLEVWLDLPDEIKFDPALAPFKNLYEQNHGKLLIEEEQEVGDNVYPKPEELKPITENTDIKLISGRSGSNGLVQPANSDYKNRERERTEKSSRRKKVEKALRVLKLLALVACWVVLTVALLMNREKTDIALHTAVLGGEVKEYLLETTQENVKIHVMLTGPFAERAGNNSSSKEIYLWLHRRYYDGARTIEQNSSSWIINLRPEDELDFAPSATDTKTLVLDGEHSAKDQRQQNGTQVFLQMHTTINRTVPLTLTYQMHPIDEKDGIIYATLLLCLLYILIIFEIVNRTIAALLSSSLGVGILAINGTRPTLPELVSWLDVETLLLLFSMMLLVAIMADTGLFDFLAVKAFEVTGGRIWPLINCLCLFTAIMSTFLDNVTTVLLMTPVTIRLCEVMELNPVPVLMSMVIFSNVGGAATPVGDPPNVIIASHPSILNANINFTTFTMHMGIGILLVSVQTYFQLRYMFRDISKLRHSVPRYIQEMRQELAVWRRAAASLSSYSRDEDIVRNALEKKVERLNVVLSKTEAGKSGGTKLDATFCTTLAEMKIKYHIRDKPLLIKCIVCVSFVVVVFFLHAIPELQRLSLGWTALLGALLLLVLSEREDLEPILARVEWSTLLFFAALFVLMEALSKLGLISWIGNITESLIRMVDEKSQLAVAIMLILWVSGLASAFVDNIPLATMMVRVTAALAAPSGLGLPLPPLAWALSFGACLGGNGTLIGASANVVCAGVAEQHGYRFTFLQYLKIGFPVMIGNLVVASVYLLFCHCVLEWH